MAEAQLLGRESVLITGLEGSGKSHYLMSQVKKMIDEDFEGHIYIANVHGITLENSRLHIVDKDFNWLTAEPNSVVIYDEAGTIERFSNLNRKLHTEELQMISQRRKTGILLVFVAQDSKMINSSLRQLLKFHFHFSNPYNDGKKTHCFVFAGVKSQLSSDNKAWHGTAIEEFDHVLDPDIFPLYKSIDDKAKHNKKKQVNKKAKLLFIIAGSSLVLCVILFIFGIKLAKSYYSKNIDAEHVQAKIDNTSGVASSVGASVKSVDSNVVPNVDLNGIANVAAENEAYMNAIAKRTRELYAERLPEDYQILAYNNDLRINGVVFIGGNCYAYNQYGERLNVSKSHCIEQFNVGMIKSHHGYMRAVTDNTSTGGNAGAKASGEPVEMPLISH